MRIDALDLSFSEQEASAWLVPMLRDMGIEAVCLTFATGCIEVAGRATRPLPVPFTILLRPQVDGAMLWLEVESVQAIGPLGSWLQGPLLSLAASRLSRYGVIQAGRSLGVDVVTLIGQGKREASIDVLDMQVDHGRLRLAVSGNLEL
jgi:hypothetical protein